MRRPGSDHITQSFDEARADVSIRPARKREKKQPAPYSIRFDEEERARLDRDARGMSWAAYIRSVLFPDQEPTLRPKTRKRRKPEIDETLAAQILGALGQSRLSSNMNQIAKGANLGTLPVTPELEEYLLAACSDIREMRQALMRALGLVRVEDEL